MKLIDEWGGLNGGLLGKKDITNHSAIQTLKKFDGGGNSSSTIQQLIHQQNKNKINLIFLFIDSWIVSWID